MNIQTGLITSAFGRHYQLETDNHQRLLAHPRGKKSEAVVGDRVQWQHSQDEAVIEKILPRRNLFYRQDEIRTKAFAANLDQILIMIAAEPEFSESQLSRALIAAAAEEINAIIILNKADLATPFQKALERLHPYIQMGYQIKQISLKNNPAENTTTPDLAHNTPATQQILPLLHGKTTLVLGPSGAGKSTLINTLIPDAQAQTNELSKALKTGKHTTTTSQWYWLPNHKGAIIDSPGFQEFGLNHIPPENLAQLMPDIRQYSTQCRFYNCTHLHEPGCGVIQAVESGYIPQTRYRIYCDIMQDALNASKY